MGETTEKIRKIIIKYWPIFAIVLLILLFAFPYWAKNLIPFPSNYLVNAFPPWQYYYGLAIKNDSMPDVITQMYPWKHLAIELWQNGIIPLWNPYNFSGSPFLANYQSAVFHPFNLLFFILPEVEAWSLLILIQPLLAGLFTYLFCRELKLSQAASFLSAVAFMFSGFMVTWMTYGTMVHAMLWLPLVLYGLQKSFQKITRLPLILISLSLGASFFSGHFQVSLYVLMGVLAFLFYQLVVTRKKKTFLICLLFVILGVSLAAVQILPTFELYQHSVRSQSASISEIIPWSYSITLLAPDFFGNPVTRNDWLGNFNEWAGFAGVMALMLAFYALISQRKKEVFFFAILFLICLFLSRPSPILDLIARLKIPVLSSSAAARVNGLLAFSVAILAGFGFDELKKNLAKRKYRAAYLTAFIFLALCLGVWLLLLLGQPFPANKIVIAKRNFILPTGLVAFFGLLIFGFWWLNKIFKGKKRIISYSLLLLLLALLALTTFDLFRFAKKWMPFDPKEHVYPSLPILEYLTEETGHDRVFGYFGMEMMNYYQIQGFGGYDPLYIQRYGELLMSANQGQVGKPSTRGVSLERRAKYTIPLVNLMGAKYILHAFDDGQHVWTFNFWDYPDDFKLIHETEEYQVYENLRALPRAYFFYHYLIIKEPQEIIDQMFARGLDLKETLILEEEPELEAKDIKEKGKRKAEIIYYSPNQVRLEVQSENPGFVFLSDNYYPGWKALVDGEETKIYRANYTFRAIEVPQGTHEVNFVYDPVSFKYGLIISSLSLLAVLSLSLLLPRWKK